MHGNKSYQIEYLATVVLDDIPALPKTARELIKKAIEERLTVNPIGFGKPLQFSLKGHRRLRVSYYRIIYRIIENERKVLITAIKHRKDVYKK